VLNKKLPPLKYNSLQWDKVCPSQKFNYLIANINYPLLRERKVRKERKF
jgi:hypothetical protein